MYKKIINYLFYIIIFVLILIMIFTFAKVLHKEINYVPKNSINVSPITGERLEAVYQNVKNPMEVTYMNSNETDGFAGMGDADIVYEYMNGETMIYKAIFYNKMPEKKFPITHMDNINLDALPKFNFLDMIDLSLENRKNATVLFISFSPEFYSNFVYEDGLYYHFKNNVKDTDENTNKPISISNIIIQLVDESSPYLSKDIDGKGDGLLFCGGKVMNIKWNKESKPIKITDEQGNDVSLLRGKTWWIIVKKNTSVVYK